MSLWTAWRNTLGAEKFQINLCQRGQRGGMPWSRPCIRLSLESTARSRVWCHPAPLLSTAPSGSSEAVSIATISSNWRIATISKRKLPLLRKLWVHCLLNCKVHSLHLATALVTDWELVHELSYASLQDLGRLADETRERTLVIVSIDLRLPLSMGLWPYEYKHCFNLRLRVTINSCFLRVYL